MLARSFITDQIPPIKTSDTVSDALKWMETFKVHQLPVVNHRELLALITEEDLLNSEDKDLPIGSLRLSLPQGTYVVGDTHIYDVLKLIKLFKLDILPVLDPLEGHYLGLISAQDALQSAAEMLNVAESGGVIVLQVSNNSYMLSEIARICESNDAKVLSLSVTPSPNPTEVYITLKLNLRELSRVISTFERFEYHIATVVFDAEQLEDYRENYANLMRYLEV